MAAEYACRSSWLRHPRCPLAFDRCPTVDPPLFDVGPAHQAACLLVEDGR